MLHGGVVEVDLEPVPDEDGRAGKSQDVQHDAPVAMWVVGLSMRLAPQPGQRGPATAPASRLTGQTDLPH